MTLWQKSSIFLVIYRHLINIPTDSLSETKVLELILKFVKPCLVGTEVKVEVNLSEKRKISLATYKVSDVQSQDTVFVQGTARLLLK